MCCRAHDSNRITENVLMTYGPVSCLQCCYCRAIQQTCLQLEKHTASYLTAPYLWLHICISPWAVCQINVLRRICDIFVHNHVPNDVILNRCNTLSVELQLQGKILRWLGHVFQMHNNRLPKKLLLGEIEGLCPACCPRFSNDVVACDCQDCQLVGLTGMHKTGCTEETRLVLHVPSST